MVLSLTNARQKRGIQEKFTPSISRRAVRMVFRIYWLFECILKELVLTVG